MEISASEGPRHVEASKRLPRQGLSLPLMRWHPRQRAPLSLRQDGVWKFLLGAAGKGAGPFLLHPWSAELRGGGARAVLEEPQLLHHRAPILWGGAAAAVVVQLPSAKLPRH